MTAEGDALVDLTLIGHLIEWRGPAPFYFVAVPDAQVGEVRWAATRASYGWGCVPVKASVAGVEFTTSLFPRDGGYLVPLKADVRRRAGIGAGAAIRLRLRVFDRG